MIDETNVAFTGVVGQWGILIDDIDGTLTGTVGALTTGHPMITNGSCTQVGSNLMYLM
jgi:hypothetical protein